MNGIRIEEGFMVLIVLNPKCTEMFLILNTLKQKGLPVLANGGLRQKTTGGKAQPSRLNKGSPYSEVHVSRMP